MTSESENKLPATGKQITLRGVKVQSIRNGRTAEHWGGSNSLEALLELGVVWWASGDGPGIAAADLEITSEPGAASQGTPDWKHTDFSI
jgi:hypothetical protein